MCTGDGQKKKRKNAPTDASTSVEKKLLVSTLFVYKHSRAESQTGRLRNRVNTAKANLGKRFLISLFNTVDETKSTSRWVLTYTRMCSPTLTLCFVS